MLYEGIKETQNTRIEKDNETNDEIEMLYTFEVVLFEHVLLESEKLIYSICYFAPKGIYDIVIENKEERKLVSYEVMKELTNQYKEYFNLIKNEEINTENEKIKCTSHSIEYTL